VNSPEWGLEEAAFQGYALTQMDPDAIFLSENGLRAGWRLLIWVFIFLFLSGTISIAVIRIVHPQAAFLDPGRFIVGDLVSTFVPALIATWVMARFEHRTFSDYYFPAKTLFGGKFGWGIVWGFLAVSLLAGLIAAFGGYRILGVQLSGVSLVDWTLLWIGAALAIGVVEEFTFRGYILRTLAEGIGFWPAAILLSIGFGALHYFSKPYERWEDFASTGLLGLFLCLTIKKTNTLAFAIGWHAAFDWGALYLYSGRNAGEFAVGRLLRTEWPGSDRLTGGMLGPEASWLVFLVIALLFLGFAVASRKWRDRASPSPEPTAITK
jgi:CAAX protease family protein